MPNVIVIVAALTMIGCGSVSSSKPDANVPNNCSVSCSMDSDCASGNTCSFGRCTNGPSCPCTAGEFVGCSADNTSANVCNAAGDGVDVQPCAHGCNATAAKCNVCTPGQATCSSDMKSAVTCSPDGLSMATDSCALNCSTTGTPHCETIVPAYASTVCDTLATSATFNVTAPTTLNTSMDAMCNGGVLHPGEPNEICVVRNGTITIGANLTVVGRRSLALVADKELRVMSEIDVSATDRTDGPGGGLCTSGLKEVRGTPYYEGGGGAGFRNAGGAGYNHAGSGGGVYTHTKFSGGCRPEIPDATDAFGGIANGGGAGGGLMLIACRGTVTVSGLIDANGGGGAGGSQGNAFIATGGGGGGAGGFVILQGAQVVVTGSFYANGGAGGGGAKDNASAPGNPGQDGQRSTAAAVGGVGVEGGGSGGRGGTGSLVPLGGGSPSIGTGAGGGGGGSAGRLRVYTPTGVTPAVAPTAASPAFDTNDTVQVK